MDFYTGNLELNTKNVRLALEFWWNHEDFKGDAIDEMVGVIAGSFLEDCEGEEFFRVCDSIQDILENELGYEI